MLKVSFPSDFKNKHRKKLIELPSGLVVEIQKVEPLQYMSKLDFLSQSEILGIGNMDETQRQEAIAKLEVQLENLKNDKGQQLKALEYLVTAGVSRPMVVSKLAHEVADDEIAITDFGDDLDSLIEEITDFSGFKNLGSSTE